MKYIKTLSFYPAVKHVLGSHICMFYRQLHALKQFFNGQYIYSESIITYIRFEQVSISNSPIFNLSKTFWFR